METKTKEVTDTMVGGYTKFSCVSKEEQDVFNSVQFPLGVDYQAIACATQVVAGTNYKFFCNAKVVYPNSPNETALVTIYKPLEGSPVITEIHKVS